MGTAGTLCFASFAVRVENLGNVSSVRCPTVTVVRRSTTHSERRQAWPVRSSAPSGVVATDLVWVQNQGIMRDCSVARLRRERWVVRIDEAFESWGSFNIDDPFPLFAQVREEGAVHPVTLADGHEAWLVVRFEEAMAALNDPRLSKDMHAALASGSEVVAEGLPGPEFARHMLTVGPARPLPASQARLRRVFSEARRGPTPTRPNHYR